MPYMPPISPSSTSGFDDEDEDDEDDDDDDDDDDDVHHDFASEYSVEVTSFATATPTWTAGMRVAVRIACTDAAGTAMERKGARPARSSAGGAEEEREDERCFMGREEEMRVGPGRGNESECGKVEDVAAAEEEEEENEDVDDRVGLEAGAYLLVSAIASSTASGSTARNGSTGMTSVSTPMRPLPLPLLPAGDEFDDDDDVDDSDDGEDSDVVHRL